MFDFTFVLSSSSPLLRIRLPQQIKLKINNRVCHSLIVCHTGTPHQPIRTFHFFMVGAEDKRERQHLDIGSNIAKVGPELAMLLTMTVNVWSSRLHFPSTGLRNVPGLHGVEDPTSGLGVCEATCLPIEPPHPVASKGIYSESVLLGCRFTDDKQNLHRET